MRWLVKKKNFTCSCTPAGVLVTTMDFTRRRNGNYEVDTLKTCIVAAVHLSVSIKYDEETQLSKSPCDCCTPEC